MPRESREKEIEKPETLEQPQGDRIVALWVRDRVYSSAEYDISVFSQASFKLESKHEPSIYLIIPTRAIDLIKFEKGAPRGNQ